MSITYTEELQGSINNSNDEFIQEEYNLDHANNAAKLSLYYAHGNTEKNAINYRTAKIDENRAYKLNTQAVQGINLASNANSAANQALVDSGKATSNISTAAANMQIAANAITKLSSDVAGILAVANAADHGSQIQDSVDRANNKARRAAKLAEEVSLISLSATIEAAQSTASTVVTDAQLASSSMASFQSATAAQYSATSALSVTDNEGLTEARKTEKSASGAYDITRKQDSAIKTTRSLINQVSNHDLELFDPMLPKNAKKVLKVNNNQKPDSSYAVEAGQSYTISFEKLPGDGMQPIPAGQTPSVEDGDYIQNYRLIMVKYDAADAFDINMAKNLDNGTYYQFDPNGYKGYSRTFYLLGTDQALIPYDPKALVETDPILQNSYESKHVRGIAVDYNGKPIVAGEYYVAYVYAVYTDDYQKLINNTDGFLSLATKDMQLQMNLPRIPVSTLDSASATKRNLIMYDPTDLNSRDFAVQFEVYQKDYDPDLMEYRVILVEKANVDAMRLNRAVEAALENLDDQEYQYNIEKQKLQGMKSALNNLEIKFNTLQIQISEVESQLQTVDTQIAGYGTVQVPQHLTGQKAQLTSQLVSLRESLTQNNQDQISLEGQIYGPSTSPGGQQQVVSDAETAYENALQADETISKKKIEGNVSDFIFDSDLMDVVTPADYYVAKPFRWSENSAKILVRESNQQLQLDSTLAMQAIIDYATYNTEVKAAAHAVQKAENDVMTATTTFNMAETALDQAEMNALSSTNPSAADKAIELAILALNVAQLNLDNKNNIHASKEIDLEVLKANHAQSSSDIEGLLDNYVSASEGLDNANTILELSKELKKVNKGQPAGLERVLFYTETGEDATDNYGEPLQFNDTSGWETTFDVLQDLWTAETDRLKPQYMLVGALGLAIEAAKKKEATLKKAIQATVTDMFKDHGFKEIFDIIIVIAEVKAAIEIEKEIATETLAKAIISAVIKIEVLKAASQLLDNVVTTYLSQKESSHEISYQAVVLTTITSDDEDVVLQYRLQHSVYSKAHALWGVVE